VRLRAASAARRDADTLIIGRTDALRATKSLEAVIERSRAFADAGVDALMVLDLEPSQAYRVHDALPYLPLIWIGGVVAPIPSAAAIAKAGFSLAVYPFNTLAGVAAAVTDLWKDFVDNGTVTQDAEMLRAMRDELNQIVDLEAYLRIEGGED
jgi:2-methylisocitrate lyase-like PEP mutase family enzyme